MKKTEIEFALMGWLNEHRAPGAESYFDCGRYGVLQIYWTGDFGGHWNCRWIMIDPCPIDLSDSEITNGKAES